MVLEQVAAADTRRALSTAARSRTLPVRPAGESRLAEANTFAAVYTAERARGDSFAVPFPPFPPPPISSTTRSLCSVVVVNSLVLCFIKGLLATGFTLYIEERCCDGTRGESS